jgi:hypothetical protein
MTCSNGNGGLSIKLGEFGNEVRKQRLLNEERLVGFESTGELFRHPLVYATVEIETGVKSNGFNLLESLNGSF